MHRPWKTKNTKYKANKRMSDYNLNSVFMEYISGIYFTSIKSIKKFALGFCDYPEFLKYSLRPDGIFKAYCNKKKSFKMIYIDL